MTSGFIRICAALCAIIAPLGWHAAVAKPLSSEACAKLVSEHAELKKSGIEKAMDQEPDNAGAVLKAEQLANIERFLFIEGQIRFRCPEIRLAVPDPPKPDPAPAAEVKKKEPEKPSGPTVPLPQRKPPTPKKKAG